MSITEAFVEWCADPSPSARFERTVVQGIVSVIVTELPQTLSGVNLPDWVSAIIVPVIMSILAIIQAEIGRSLEGGEE